MAGRTFSSRIRMARGHFVHGMGTSKGLLLLGLQVFTMMTALAISVPPRHLTPTPQKLLQHAENTMWSRELQVASDIVTRRRRRKRQLQSTTMGGKNNDYLPEDDPELLLVALDEDPDVPTTQCLSPLQKWFVSLIESIGVETWELIIEYNITSLAYLYKHHISSADGNQEYFGTYGERTEEMMVNHQSLMTFWYTGDDTRSVVSMASGHSPVSTPNQAWASSNVLLLGMHGVDLAEDNKLVPTLEEIYGMDGSEAYALARSIQSIVESIPGAFNNPVFTANAIAIQTLNPNGSKSELDSIIVGDGVFTFLEWLNLRNDGPDYIHSHEFGHHLQYDLGIDNVASGWSASEETRRWEMMADAFGSYYLAHSRGGRMDAKRLLEVHRAAFSLGDCEDAIGSHHGTPRQRECASNYGANLALQSYMDGGYIVPPSDLRRIFDEKYEKILELDKDECYSVLDSSLLDKAIYGEILGNSDGNSGSLNEPPPSDLETPTLDFPAPSPDDTPKIEYKPWGGYTPEKEYQTSGTSPQNDWNHGTTFEEENHSSSPADELDKPPSNVQNGIHSEDQGWFGEAEDEWANSRTAWSAGNRLGIGWTFIGAVFVKILLL
ncbi:hypothetical protein ACHAXR_009655 [Thalassiosira sp. AJA248-18]